MNASKQAKPAPQPVLPAGPLQPITLDQMPAAPPEVSYRAGQLTVTAENSSLGDILRAVRSQSGASFDIPPSATERVVGRFGPGPANQVLATLLNGSHFNYVILGSATDPTAVAQLVLTPKPGGTSENAPESQANQGFNNTGPTTAFAHPINPNMQGQPPQVVGGDGAMDGENGTDGDEAVDQADQGDQEGAPQGLPQQPNGQPAVKTPQQLLQELQQQQLLQQQQQGQNPQQIPPANNPNLIPPQRPELQQRERDR